MPILVFHRSQNMQLSSRISQLDEDERDKAMDVRDLRRKSEESESRIEKISNEQKRIIREQERSREVIPR